MFVFKCFSHLEMLGKIFWNLKAPGSVLTVLLCACQAEPLTGGVFTHYGFIFLFFLFPWVLSVR